MVSVPIKLLMIAERQEHMEVIKIYAAAIRGGTESDMKIVVMKMPKCLRGIVKAIFKM